MSGFAISLVGNQIPPNISQGFHVSFVPFDAVVDVIDVRRLKIDQLDQSAANIHAEPRHRRQRIVDGLGHHGNVDGRHFEIGRFWRRLLAVAVGVVHVELKHVFVL